MTRPVPVPVQTHLDLTTRTMTEILEVTQVAMMGGTVLRLTRLNRPLVIASGSWAGTYLPLGYPRKDMTAADDMGVGSAEFDGIQASPYLVEDDIRAGRWSGATWRAGWVNYVTPADGVVALNSGALGNISWGRVRFTAELLDLLQRLQNGIGRLNSPLCIHKLGAADNGPGLGNGCTVDLAPFTFARGPVTAMDSDFYGVHLADTLEATTYFSNGIFRVDSGVMTGMEFEIRAHVLGAGPEGFIILFTALPFDVTGEDYTIIRGCNKTLRQCVDDFNNITDRLASDYTQGNDAAFATARQV